MKPIIIYLIIWASPLWVYLIVKNRKAEAYVIGQILGAILFGAFMIYPWFMAWEHGLRRK
jgi:glycerol uptake facilitator-like aquaporin